MLNLLQQELIPSPSNKFPSSILSQLLFPYIYLILLKIFDLPEKIFLFEIIETRESHRFHKERKRFINYKTLFSKRVSLLFKEHIHNAQLYAYRQALYRDECFFVFIIHANINTPFPQDKDCRVHFIFLFRL